MLTPRTAAALARVDTILRGISEDEEAGGWWETGEGASFGASRLALVRQLVIDLGEGRPMAADPAQFAASPAIAESK